MSLNELTPEELDVIIRALGECKLPPEGSVSIAALIQRFKKVLKIIYFFIFSIIFDVILCNIAAWGLGLGLGGTAAEFALLASAGLDGGRLWDSFRSPRPARFNFGKAHLSNCPLSNPFV